MTLSSIAFIGGGNMAGALIGGLLRSGWSAACIGVVEPNAAQRDALASRFGVRTLGEADATLASADCVAWAVKPQLFKAAAAPCFAHVGGALQLSVMAGIRTDAIAQATGSDRVVRAMPNTPALIGEGMSGLYARAAVSPDERAQIEMLLAPTGQTLWVDREEQLDAVTALSGSGPAYVFYVLEALIEAGTGMGLSAAQSKQLAVATLAGATSLARDSDETPAVLRERVTSKGGTTHAAIASLDADGVRAAFVRALKAAQQRAVELGDEFGR
ncbi:MAG: pyrroline-5-carboxylate reductase [Burkholderiaceae bacterium]|nr:pyrroline-5-carboxylate reductase [Burkholderiaceae bacterium]